MPVALQLETVPLEPPPRHKQWTRRECQILLENGVFEGQRYELVEGELINKLGQNPPHAFAISNLTVILVQLFGRQVRCQLPIDVAPADNPTSEPEPDAIVTNTAADFSQRGPTPAEVAWLIEVSDSTLRFDLTTKARLYARAAIADYWVLDLANRRIIDHREPTHGHYGSVTVYAAHEAIAPLLAPHHPCDFSGLTQ